MFNNLKYKILNGWTLPRFLTLGLAIIVLSEWWNNQDIIFGLAGLFLLYRSLLQAGCCGTMPCDIDQARGKSKSLNPGVKSPNFNSD